MKKIVLDTWNTKETFNLGKKLGKLASKGEIYCLEGDLGTGKTVFTQGFATGLGIIEPVNSPTFTILQVYEEGRLPLYHFDVYRIGDPDYFFGEGVCLIEWPSLIEELLPEDVCHIQIEKDLEKGTDYREIELLIREDKADEIISN